MQARVQSLKHAMLLRNRSDTEKELTHAFTEAVRSSAAKKGGTTSASADAVLDEWGEEAKWASLKELRGALEELRHPLLSSMQVVSLMSDAAALQREDDGRADVVRWCCLRWSHRSYVRPHRHQRKAALCTRAEMQFAALMQGMEREVESELGELFSRFDADGNGVLDKDEFMHLLDATSLGLTPRNRGAI